MPLRDDRGDIDREILDIIPERFDVDADSRYARKNAQTRLILTVALALLALAALGVAARHLFFGEAPKQAQTGVPMIHAEDKPIKTKPQDRGGMDVPNQDKLVYEKMGAGEAEPQTERLLPPPEQPQAPPAQQPRKPSIKPAFPAPPLKETPAAAKPGALEPPPPAAAPEPEVTTAPTSAPPVSPAPPAQPAPRGLSPVKPTTPQQAATAPASKPAATAPAPAAKQASAASPAAAVTAPAKAAPAGAWLVQLGALKSEAEAKSEWGRVRGANKDLLGELSSDIVRVDLGAKGIFWRLRAGPMDEARARTLCASLAKRSQGCIVAKK